MTAAGLAPASDLYLLQGGLLFFAGTMLGIPHGLAKRNGDAKRTELWRVAHLSTCVAGVSLIALTVALERLFGPAAPYTLAPFSASAWCFFIACTLSAWLGKSWDDDRTQACVQWVYRLQMLAALLSVVATAAFLLTMTGKALS